MPDTSNWNLNIKYLVPALERLGLQLFQGINVILNFKNLSMLTLQLLNSDAKKIFVIPEWHCAPWFKPLFGILKKKTHSTKLPDEPDLFTDELGNPIGVFSYSHWLYATANAEDSSGGTLISFFPANLSGASVGGAPVET